jgi:outer membrane autotransporter protein
MTVTGNFTQTASGTYTTEVAGAGASDRINVTGTATLGGQVVVTALPGMAFAPSTTYTIVSAAGGLSGTFASVNELYPFLLSSLSYDARRSRSLNHRLLPHGRDGRLHHRHPMGLGL